MEAGSPEVSLLIDDKIKLPGTLGEASMGGCDSQPVEHQCVL